MSVSRASAPATVWTNTPQFAGMFASGFCLPVLFFSLIGDFIVDATFKCDFIRGHLFEDSGVHVISSCV